MRTRGEPNGTRNEPSFKVFPYIIDEMSDESTRTRAKVVDMYVDLVRRGFSITDPMRIASIGHIDAVDNLYRSDAPVASIYVDSIDDVKMADGDAVLIKDQHDSTQNGVYTVLSTSDGKYLRKSKTDIATGIAYVVESGTRNGGTVWISNVDENNPNNVTFVSPEKIAAQVNESSVPVLQTVSTTSSNAEYENLTVARTALATVDGMYIGGNCVSSGLFLTNGPFELAANIDDPSHLTIDGFGDVFRINSGSIQAAKSIGFYLSGNDVPSLFLNAFDNAATVSGNLQCLGGANFLGDVTIAGNLKMHGTYNIQGELRPHELHVNIDPSISDLPFHPKEYGQITVVGAANSAKGGPHFTTFTQADHSPLINICSYAHDDISLNIDCYYDGSFCIPSHATACQLRKFNGQFQLNYLDSVAECFKPAISIDLTDGSLLCSASNAVFANQNGTDGTVKLLPQSSGETSVAFYRKSVLNTALPNDFWKMSLDTDANVFAIKLGSGTTMLSFTESGVVTVPGTFDVEQNMVVRRKLNVAGNVVVDNVLTSCYLHVTSTDNVSNRGTAALVVDGGMQIGKSMVVNDYIVAGRLSLSSEQPRLTFTSSSSAKNQGQGPPILNGNSGGVRINLDKNISPTTTNISIGIDKGTLWCSVPSTMESCAFKWYAGTENIMSLDGIGSLIVRGKGNGVRFTGLSSAGLQLYGADANDPTTISFSDSWKMGTNIDGSFSIDVKSSTSDTSRDNIMRISPSDGTINVIGGIHAVGSITAASFAASYVSIGNNKVRLSDFGLTVSGNAVLTFPSATSALSLGYLEGVPLDVNGLQHGSQRSIVSDTNINRNNEGAISFWNGGQIVGKVDRSGWHVNRGDLYIHDGSIEIERGDLRIPEGLLVVDLLQCQHDLRLGSSDVSGASFSMQSKNLDFRQRLDDDSQQAILQCDRDIVLESKSGTLSVVAGKSATIVAPLVEISTPLFKGHASEQLGSVASLIGRNGQIMVYNHRCVVSGSDQYDTWYYVGRLNTSIGSAGRNEVGGMTIKVRTSGNTVGTVTFDAQMSSDGRCNFQHGRDFRARNDDDEISTVVHVYRNDDAKDTLFRDLHVFLSVPKNSTASVTIENYATDAPVRLHDEGDGTVPNGSESKFASDAWTEVYRTDESVNKRQTTGFVECTDGLHVDKDASVNGDLSVKNRLKVDEIVTIDGITVSTSDKDETICRMRSDGIVVNASLSPPCATNDIALGTFDNAFSRVHSRDIFVERISCTGTSNCAIFQSAEANIDTLNISQSARIAHTTTGNLIVDQDATFASSLLVGGGATFGDVDVKGRLSSNSVNLSGNLSVAGDATVRGKIVFSGNELLDVVVQKMRIGRDDNGLIIDSNGELTAPDRMQFSLSGDTGKTTLLSLGYNNVSICDDVGFEVLSPFSHFANDVELSKNMVVAGDASVGGDLHLTGTGKLIVDGRQRLTWTPNSVAVSSDTMIVSGLVESTNILCTGTTRSDRLEIGASGHLSIDPDGRLALRADATDHTEQEAKLDNLLLDPTGKVILQGRSADIPLQVIGAPGSICVFDSRISVRDGLTLGIGRESSALSLVNDTDNAARIELYPLDSDRRGDLYVVNDGGRINVHAAGQRGLTIAATSGNATFDGTVTITSALDSRSTNDLDSVDSAALFVKGGAFFGGTLVIENDVILSDMSKGRIALGVPDGASSYRLVFPSSLPVHTDTDTDANSVLSCDGQGRLSWMMLPNRLSASHEVASQVADVSNAIYGADATMNPSSGFETGTAALGVRGATFVNKKKISKMPREDRNWGSIFVDGPVIKMDRALQDAPYTASTLYITDGPKVVTTGNIVGDDDQTARTYAVNVNAGRVRFGDTKEVTSVDEAAMVVEGGLSVKKSLRCGGILSGEYQMIGDGTTQKKVIVGKFVVGTSVTPCVTAPLQYTKDLPDDDYVIVGNVISAIEDDAMYLCSFKSLNRRGCKVTVCRMDGQNWDDVTVTVHYYIVSYVE